MKSQGGTTGGRGCLHLRPREGMAVVPWICTKEWPVKGWFEYTGMGPGPSLQVFELDEQNDQDRAYRILLDLWISAVVSPYVSPADSSPWNATETLIIPQTVWPHYGVLTVGEASGVDRWCALTRSAFLATLSGEKFPRDRKFAFRLRETGSLRGPFRRCVLACAPCRFSEIGKCAKREGFERCAKSS